MRFIFKTGYDQDIDLAKHSGHLWSYGLLMLFLCAAPWLMEEYWLAQLTFVLIYGIVGLGLMLLAGFTGLGDFCQALAAGTGIALNRRVMSTNDCSTPIRSRLDAPTNPTQSVC